MKSQKIEFQHNIQILNCKVYKTKRQLEQVMLVKNLPNSDILIYGKTGMGKDK